jgi:hypothetical protein
MNVLGYLAPMDYKTLDGIYLFVYFDEGNVHYLWHQSPPLTF